MIKITSSILVAVLLASIGDGVTAARSSNSGSSQIIKGTSSFFSNLLPADLPVRNQQNRVRRLKKDDDDDDKKKKEGLPKKRDCKLSKFSFCYDSKWLIKKNELLKTI
jgi:hypothetical protein